jgi:hypothetical protein
MSKIPIIVVDVLFIKIIYVNFTSLFGRFIEYSFSRSRRARTSILVLVFVKLILTGMGRTVLFFKELDYIID